MAAFTTVREALEAAYARTQHDAAVLELATAWKRGDGAWEVYANLDGWEKPPELGGHVPDVFARRLGVQVAVEVETQAALATARVQAQVVAFRAWERGAAGRRFHLKVL
jgi:hypothetical protein